jgi:Ca2+-binding EF-hand superfamily protein
MKRVFAGIMFFTLSLLVASTLIAGAASTPATLPGDTDQDGSISCSEATQQTADLFGKMDANSDKQITMGEFEAGTTKNFEAMDADKNGMVNVQEYLVTWCGAPAKDAKSSIKTSQGKAKSIHKNMDTNKNGKVTVNECVTFWTVRFADNDANKDGSITKDEFDKKVVEWFSISDVNKDGSVTTVEFTDRWVGMCQAEKLKKSLSKK